MLVAAIQLTSKNNKKKNLTVAKDLMIRAVRQGAELICLPEYFSYIGSRTELAKEAEPPYSGQAFDFCKNFAKENKVFILAGSIPTHDETKGKNKKFFNRSTLFDSKGNIAGMYDKIHLFNSELADSKGFNEADTFQPGSMISTVETPFGTVGLTVCYDLRFPELFRSLAVRGSRIIFVPSAFTMYTGKDHWLALLRARAIENQVYIIAPAQYGQHSESKKSFGKSCIIDPWGNTVALAPDCETVITADIDFKFQSKIRKELPVLKHFRKDLFQF